jgi:hypothetical protein
MYNKGEGMCWSMKKYKQLILGIIIGVMIASVVPVGAAIQEYICHKVDYKVVVNGVEYVNEELPGLNYKGSTYAPFRSILEAAGLVVNWNAEYRVAEVNIPEGGIADMRGKPPTIQLYYRDDMTFTMYNEKEYVKYTSLAFHVTALKRNNETGEAYCIHPTTQSELRNIPITVICGTEFIETDYYNNTIIPFLNEE